MDADSILNVCRLCLITENLSNGLLETHRMPDIIEQARVLLGVEIRPTDKFTKKLCKECTKKLADFSVYFEAVQSNQKILKDRFVANEQLQNLMDQMEASIIQISDDESEPDTKIPIGDMISPNIEKEDKIKPNINGNVDCTNRIDCTDENNVRSILAESILSTRSTPQKRKYSSNSINTNVKPDLNTKLAQEKIPAMKSGTENHIIALPKVTITSVVSSKAAKINDNRITMVAINPNAVVKIELQPKQFNNKTTPALSITQDTTESAALIDKTSDTTLTTPLKPKTIISAVRKPKNIPKKAAVAASIIKNGNKLISQAQPKIFPVDSNRKLFKNVVQNEISTTVANKSKAGISTVTNRTVSKIAHATAIKPKTSIK